jgi:type I restriction enzyme S subunit
MYPTVSFSEFADLNPKVPLVKRRSYKYVQMDAIEPGTRYVKAAGERVYDGGGAKFKSGDTLFARITPCLENGKIAQFRGDSTDDVAFGSTEFWVFRAKPHVSDPSYLFYLSLSDILRRPAEKSMVGASGRQRADMNAVIGVEVPAPLIGFQQHIGSILSAYDDLIENNTRRIKILEELAKTIYREWFVNFRFPGHENVR